MQRGLYFIGFNSKIPNKFFLKALSFRLHGTTVCLSKPHKYKFESGYSSHPAKKAHDASQIFGHLGWQPSRIPNAVTESSSHFFKKSMPM